MSKITQKNKQENEVVTTLKDDIQSLRKIDDLIEKTTAQDGVRDGLIKNIMARFESFNGLKQAQWDINRRELFNKVGITIKQKNADKIQLKNAIDLLPQEKSVVSKIRKYQSELGLTITSKTTWYEIKTKVAPKVNKNRKANFDKMKKWSDDAIQNAVDYHTAMQSKAKFEAFASKVKKAFDQAEKEVKTG